MKRPLSSGFLSPLRYPGGKGALANFVKATLKINELHDGDYAEVYAGGAGIAWALLLGEYVRRVHINDLNFPLMCFWRSVIGNTESLSKLIYDTPVTMENWYASQHVLSNHLEFSELEVGFSVFFLNRANRSGILDGGVIGGKGQNGNWKLDARFNKADLVARIQEIALFSSRILLYSLDAREFIKEVLPGLPPNSLVYLDPPYFVKGQGLYINFYNREDHAEIARLVSDIRNPWLVSYDAVPEILHLYKSFRSLRYNIKYKAQRRYDGSEVLFYSHGINIPAVVSPVRMDKRLIHSPLMA